jgi:hypothetical protein
MEKRYIVLVYADYGEIGGWHTPIPPSWRNPSGPNTFWDTLQEAREARKNLFARYDVLTSFQIIDLLIGKVIDHGRIEQRL